jgi:hypothetical protein
MFIVIEGEIRRKEYSGIGPFRREKWYSEPFVFKFANEGDVMSVEDCRFERKDQNGRIYLNALVNGIPCYLADFADSESSKTVDFSLLSVAGIEIHGKAILVKAVPAATETEKRYVA